jgi:DNA-binding response OmpR family regulator
VCRRIREGQQWAPVLILSARGQVGDRVRGLDVGADDYLVKPFVKDQLLARIRALLRRRPHGERARTMRVGDLVLDDRAHEVRRGDRLIDLTAREYELLHFLMRHAGEVVSQARVLGAVWGYANSRVVEVYIGYLREKLEAAGESRLIHTVRGVGYVLRP